MMFTFLSCYFKTGVVDVSVFRFHNGSGGY